MKTIRLFMTVAVLGCALVLVGCVGIAPAPAAEAPVATSVPEQSAATATPKPAAVTPTSAATSIPTPAIAATIDPTSTLAVESSIEPLSGPVEFVGQITGDPNPLTDPVGLAIDQQGHLYVIDGSNNRLQVFDANGQFLTTWGSLGYGDGQFSFNESTIHGAVAVDGQGNVYIADTYNHRIQKFTSGGQFLTIWGRHWGTDDGQFLHPIDLAVDGQGNVYVIDALRNDIQKFDSDGQFLTKWSGDGTGDGQFNSGGIAVDEQGTVYVADFDHDRVQKFDGNGQFLAEWGSSGTGDGQFTTPVDIAVDGQGSVYVVEDYGQRVQKFDSNGQFLTKWGSSGTGDGQFAHPVAIAVDAQGNIYVADYGSDRVQQFQQK